MMTRAAEILADADASGLRNTSRNAPADSKIRSLEEAGGMSHRLLPSRWVFPPEFFIAQAAPQRPLSYFGLHRHRRHRQEEYQCLQGALLLRRQGATSMLQRPDFCHCLADAVEGW